MDEGSLGWAVRRKTKTERKSLKERHSKYCKWMIMSQGVFPWMREEAENAESLPRKEEAEEGSPEPATSPVYPSLTQLPSALPTPLSTSSANPGERDCLESRRTNRLDFKMDAKKPMLQNKEGGGDSRNH